jgi:hypothetical protein
MRSDMPLAVGYAQHDRPSAYSPTPALPLIDPTISSAHKSFEQPIHSIVISSGRSQLPV